MFISTILESVLCFVVLTPGALKTTSASPPEEPEKVMQNGRIPSTSSKPFVAEEAQMLDGDATISGVRILAQGTVSHCWSDSVSQPVYQSEVTRSQKVGRSVSQSVS